MNIEDYGNIVIELYPDMAPNTVANIIDLIKKNYYQGQKIDRVVDNFIIQCGSEDANGYTHSIKGEFSENGYSKNTLKFERGTIGLARADYSSLDNSLIEKGYNSGLASFFITVKDEPNLDGIYAPFGKVTSGMNIIDKISELQTEIDEDGNKTEKPINPPTIKYIAVDTFGVEYPRPERMVAFDYQSWLMQQYYGRE